MKLTQLQKNKIIENWGDWETVHYEYDQIIRKYLKKLDLEFYNELEDLVKGAIWWFA